MITVWTSRDTKRIEHIWLVGSGEVKRPDMTGQHINLEYAANNGIRHLQVARVSTRTGDPISTSLLDLDRTDHDIRENLTETLFENAVCPLSYIGLRTGNEFLVDELKRQYRVLYGPIP